MSVLHELILVGHNNTLTWPATLFISGYYQGHRSLWDRGTCPSNIYEGGNVHGNAPTPNILEVMSFRLGLFYPVTATTVVRCILMQILCVVSQKCFSFWGTPSPRSPTGPWTPLGDFRPPYLQSSFYVPPNNRVRSTPLVTTVKSDIASFHC